MSSQQWSIPNNCSRIDYCNSLYAGLPKTRLPSTQSVMNSAVRLIARLPRFSGISTHMTDVLHWLPVASRIRYKVLLLIARAQQDLTPKISLRPGAKTFTFSLFLPSSVHIRQSWGLGESRPPDFEQRGSWGVAEGGRGVVGDIGQEVCSKVVTFEKK